MRVVILGAPATGKTRIAGELSLHLPALQVSDAPSLETWEPHADTRVLLMGLDLPGLTADQRQADAQLRTRLSELGMNYAVIYGLGPQRLRAALRHLDPEDGPAPRWAGVCEKCADPDCEFRLFTALKSSKAAGRPLA